MKVISANEMSRIEKLSYAKYGKEQELHFMETAGHALANFILLPHPQLALGSERFDNSVFLLCGKGNNAGDAYVAGRYLQEQGYKVTALQIFNTEECSHLAQANREKFTWVGGTVLTPGDILNFQFPKKGLIIDGLLGTGFHGTVTNPILDVIKKANASNLPILSIDIPSGLNASTGECDYDSVIHATWTLALEVPKTGFFLHDAWNILGHLSVVPFGLKPESLEEAHEDFTLLLEKNIQSKIPKIKRTQNKYERGSLSILAGSKGMSGAALLASHASLRAGAGIVRLLHSEEIRGDLALAPMELLRTTYGSRWNGKTRDEMLHRLNQSKAAVIGPGLSTSSFAVKILKDLLPKITCPSVLDADALNILSQESISLPKETLMTPHHGEMARLLGMKKFEAVSLEFLQKCQRYVDERNVTLILKGAPTFILHPFEKPFVCTKGDPGMASAGSGDVLSGILGALLAQGLSLKDAACLGVFLHSLAGEEAAKEKTSHAMMASDIIRKLPTAYKHLMQ